MPVYETPKCYSVDQEGRSSHRLSSIYGLLDDIESGQREPIIHANWPKATVVGGSSSSRRTCVHLGRSIIKVEWSSNPGF